MVKKYNLYSAELNLENINLKSNLPAADDLKKRFKEGSIPLQTDYADLINIADIGRKACGLAPQQTGPGEGLKLADNGTLNLKMGTLASQDFSPLILEKDILSVDLGSGLVNKTNGICVGQGNGIAVNNDNVAVKAANGITVNSSGVAVKANNGINVDTNGVSVKSKDKTINVESTGISVRLGWGIKIGDGLDVKASNGINVDSNGVSVKAGNGITVNSSGVSIDPNKVLPKGMIVMFSGSSVPTGWALCDGNNNTPNLIDRFILGGKLSDINGKSNDKASGSINAKEFRISTTNKKLTITIKGTKLSSSQMPKHNHKGGMSYFSDSGSIYGNSTLNNKRKLDNNPGTQDFQSIWGKGRNLFVETGYDTTSYYFHTSDTGNGEEHTHAVDANANIIPPYYILAFIMKT
ncbi:tail fiber protein [Photorhabdus khanii]|uniref:Tail fiber protein n=1 Tax=Photorhabdus khanii TaxID=1004150 RepID=A0A7C9GJJ3_9GAMM|nr:tail fiber protein [Photorhabdus khanii]MQL48538.1 tail fiber protein [Photorhabdus khanii]